MINSAGRLSGYFNHRSNIMDYAVGMDLDLMQATVMRGSVALDTADNPDKLKLKISQVNGITVKSGPNHVNEADATELIVQLTKQNGEPVDGASVKFLTERNIISFNNTEEKTDDNGKLGVTFQYNEVGRAEEIIAIVESGKNLVYQAFQLMVRQNNYKLSEETNLGIRGVRIGKSEKITFELTNNGELVQGGNITLQSKADTYKFKETSGKTNANGLFSTIVEPIKKTPKGDGQPFSVKAEINGETVTLESSIRVR